MTPPAPSTAPGVLTPVQIAWNAFRRIAMDPNGSRYSREYQAAEEAYDAVLRRERQAEGAA